MRKLIQPKAAQGAKSVSDWKAVNIMGILFNTNELHSRITNENTMQ